MKLRLTLLAASATLVLLFQNCSKVNFGLTENALDTSSFAATDTVVETNMNTPVEFAVDHSNPMSGMQLSFSAQNAGAPLNGQIEMKSLNDFKLKYTPNWGFRGKDYAVATVTDKYGNELKFTITVIVGNALQSLEPALAVRGMGCIQCHAQVSSNILTDFGYKNDYYFGLKPASTWWKSGGVYGDHGNSFNTIALPSDKSVIVPKADLPAVVATAQKLTTLADYMKSQLSLSATTSTKGAQVVEKSSMYIGAPTAADITQGFHMTDTERFKYFKNSDSAVTLSGLKDEGTFFRNDGVLSCEGDLAIRGPLLLDNLQINSKTGCRLYVMGSVFMYGEITYTGNDPDRNLQITSTKAISMGLGTVKKGGNFCEPGDRYAVDTASYGTSSLTNRFVTFWTVPGFFLRQSNDPKAFGQSVVAEAALIEAKAGTLYDASCRNEGRNVSYERVLLNAPVVHSRYEGNVSGTIIAEYSIMSLGMFKFSFDQVFTRVPVFPFIDKATYLDVKD